MRISQKLVTEAFDGVDKVAFIVLGLATLNPDGTVSSASSYPDIRSAYYENPTTTGTIRTRWYDHDERRGQDAERVDHTSRLQRPPARDVARLQPQARPDNSVQLRGCEHARLQLFECFRPDGLPQALREGALGQPVPGADPAEGGAGDLDNRGLDVRQPEPKRLGL
jgi:hypothetical protein